MLEKLERTMHQENISQLGLLLQPIHPVTYPTFLWYLDIKSQMRCLNLDYGITPIA